MKQQIKTLPKGIIVHGKKYRVTATYKGQRLTQVVDTLEDAKYAKAVLLEKLRNDEPKKKTVLEEATWTLKEAVQRTYTIIWEGTGGETSAMKNARMLIKYFGENTLLPSITLEAIDGFVTHCMNDIGNTGATVNRKLACLSRILRTAYDRDKIKVLPRMPRRREADHRIRFLSIEEEEKLVYILENFCDIDIHDAVLLLLHTGFRCSELWRLECRDINLVQNTITVWKTKNSLPRTVPIVHKIRDIVERRISYVDGIGRLFPMSDNAWIRNPWQLIRYHMGMENDTQFTPHMLRHTCATRLSQAGVSMPVIKEWLGHTSIATTSRYAHFSPQDLHNAAKLLDR